MGLWGWLTTAMINAQMFIPTDFQNLGLAKGQDAWKKWKKNIPQMVVKDGDLPRGFNSVISYEVTILHIGNGWVGNPFDLSMCSWGILRIRNLVGPLVRNWAIKLSMIMTHELWQLWWGFMIPHASHALLEGQPQNGFLQFCQPHLKHTVDGRNPANHLECKKPCN